MSADLTTSANGRYWWRTLTDSDPITLEPLKRLRYPPFELRASETVATLFDGRVLATYLISTGNFVHPISRRELTREDCLALDQYLTANRCVLADGQNGTSSAADPRAEALRAAWSDPT